MIQRRFRNDHNHFALEGGRFIKDQSRTRIYIYIYIIRLTFIWSGVCSKWSLSSCNCNIISDIFLSFSATLSAQRTLCNAAAPSWRPVSEFCDLPVPVGEGATLFAMLLLLLKHINNLVLFLLPLKIYFFLVYKRKNYSCGKTRKESSKKKNLLEIWYSLYIWSHNEKHATENETLPFQGNFS